VYVLPIKHSFMFNGAETFSDTVREFIESFDNCR
jgi:hypothetical protein